MKVQHVVFQTSDPKREAGCDRTRENPPELSAAHLDPRPDLAYGGAPRSRANQHIAAPARDVTTQIVNMVLDAAVDRGIDILVEMKDGRHQRKPSSIRSASRS